MAEIAVADQQPEGGGTIVDAGAPLTTSEKSSCVPEKSSWQHTGKLEAIKTSESTKGAQLDGQIILIYSAVFLGTPGDALSRHERLGVKTKSSHWLCFYANTEDPEISSTL